MAANCDWYRNKKLSSPFSPNISLILSGGHNNKNHTTGDALFGLYIFVVVVVFFQIHYRIRSHNDVH